MPVAAIVDVPHSSPDLYEEFMAEAFADLEIKKHHGAKVLLHLVVRHGDGIKIVDVTETEAEMRELEEFMFAALDHHGIKRPEVEFFPVHKLQIS